MAALINTAEGGANGTSVTTANSAGTSGDAFTAIAKPTGSSVEFSTSASADGSLGYNITTTSAVAAYLAWSSMPAATRWVGAFKFKLLSMPTTTLTISRFKGVNTAAASLGITTAGKLQLYNNAGTGISATLFTTVLSANTTYRIEYAITPGATSTSGAAEIALYTNNGSTAIETQSVTGQNFDGAAGPISQFRVGQIVAGTWNGTTYFDTIRVQDLSTGFIGPYSSGATVSAGSNQTNIEPWSTVTLTATSSSGSATWSRVSGPNPTLLGSGALTRTFEAPASFTVQTSVFRATNGAATDDVSITYLPATEGIVTSTGPVVVLPVRFIRKT
jgi:hypothetical protein